MPVATRDLAAPADARAAPTGARHLVLVAEVAPFHHVVEPSGAVAIVVVVALPDRAERIYDKLVWIAEVVAQHFDVRAVRLETERHPFLIRGELLLDAVA